jgi:hypothetical protein
LLFQKFCTRRLTDSTNSTAKKANCAACRLATRIWTTNSADYKSPIWSSWPPGRPWVKLLWRSTSSATRRNLQKNVAIFSLEMSKDQLVDRLLAAEAEVDLWKMRTGRLSDVGADNDFERIGHALGRLSEAPILSTTRVRSTSWSCAPKPEDSKPSTIWI